MCRAMSALHRRMSRQRGDDAVGFRPTTGAARTWPATNEAGMCVGGAATGRFLTAEESAALRACDLPAPRAAASGDDEACTDTERTRPLSPCKARESRDGPSPFSSIEKARAKCNSIHVKKKRG